MSINKALVFLVLMATLLNAQINDDLQGAWQNTDDPGVMVRFSGNDLFVSVKDSQFHWHIEYGNGEIILSDVWGWSEAFAYTISEDGLLNTNFKFGPGAYKKLDGIPDQLAVQPLEFGSEALTEAEISSIQEELAERVAQEQAVRGELNEAIQQGKTPEESKDIFAKMAVIDKRNRAWLIDLVQRVGWIDGKRFGKESANNAFLIVQHSQYLPLMRAALAAIQDDVAAGIIAADNYVLLYDRTRLKLGFRQRYGTQVRFAAGQPALFPIEDMETAEQLRQELGMKPLKEYLAAIEQQFGTPVKIPE